MLLTFLSSSCLSSQPTGVILVVLCEIASWLPLALSEPKGDCFFDRTKFLLFTFSEQTKHLTLNQPACQLSSILSGAIGKDTRQPGSDWHKQSHSSAVLLVEKFITSSSRGQNPKPNQFKRHSSGRLGKKSWGKTTKIRKILNFYNVSLKKLFA